MNASVILRKIIFQHLQTIFPNYSIDEIVDIIDYITMALEKPTDSNE